MSNNQRRNAIVDQDEDELSPIEIEDDQNEDDLFMADTHVLSQRRGYSSFSSVYLHKPTTVEPIPPKPKPPLITRRQVDGIVCFSSLSFSIICALISISLFIISLVFYFAVDFGNVTLEKKCNFLGRSCDSSNKCIAQLSFQDSIYKSLDEYPLSSSNWVYLFTSPSNITCFTNRALTQLSLSPITYFNDLAFLIASSSILGAALILVPLSILSTIYFGRSCWSAKETNKTDNK
ncbi:hypothetical protein ABK040_002129 [Willaertia magna]